MSNKAVITLENGAVNLEIVNGSVRSSKPITIESLSQVIEQQTAMRTPLLPGEWGTRLFARKGNREYYMITTPPGRQEITYEHRGNLEGRPSSYPFRFSDGGRYAHMEVMRPAMAWFISVDVTSQDTRKIRGETFAFALKHQVLGLNDTLYRMPFPNVYPQANVCWSGNLNSVVPTPAALVSVQSQFFGAAFNNDLDDGRFRPFESPYESIPGHDKIRRAYQLFHHLHMDLAENGDAARFPIDQLVSMDSNVGRYFNRFVEQN